MFTKSIQRDSLLAGMGEMEKMNEFFKFLSENGIEYDRHDHPPVFTVEEAKRLVPPLPGAKTKNLFLRDKKGRQHFLVVVGAEKQVDLKIFQKLLGAGRLSFGSPDRLMRYLGITPGAVSLFAIYNDRDCKVALIVDRILWESAAFQFHPLVNTSTLVISRKDVERFVVQTGHTLRTLEIPGRAAEAKT
jgi:Ala-tRNA(Pro) deacylase